MTPLEIAADPATTAATWRTWAMKHQKRGVPLIEHMVPRLLYALAEVSAEYSKLLVERDDLLIDVKHLYADLLEAQNRYDDPE